MPNLSTPAEGAARGGYSRIDCSGRSLEELRRQMYSIAPLTGFSDPRMLELSRVFDSIAVKMMSQKDRTANPKTVCLYVARKT